jgi:hypothetical protein
MKVSKKIKNISLDSMATDRHKLVVKEAHNGELADYFFNSPLWEVEEASTDNDTMYLLAWSTINRRVVKFSASELYDKLVKTTDELRNLKRVFPQFIKAVMKGKRTKGYADYIKAWEKRAGGAYRYEGGIKVVMEKDASLIRSIAKNGIKTKLRIFREDGKLHLNGNHRLTIAKEFKIPTVTVEVCTEFEL